MRFFINLTPLIPLSLKGEGEEKKEGLMPLLNAPLSLPLSKGRNEKEGASPPLKTTSPFPF
jgi:hypothetical protein